MSHIILERVTLENFKKHENLTVEFDSGLTVIRGPNYSGKSTVLEAVFFALFGTKAVPGGSSVINNRTSNSKASVTLDFTVDDEPYSITRSPTTAALTEEDQVIASGHTAVNDWVFETLGTDMKRALLLAFSMQGDTKALLDMGATKLNEFIESVSGADYVDKMAGIANNIAKRAEMVLEANPMPNVDLVELHNHKQELGKELSELGANEEAATFSVKKHTVELEGITEELQKAQKHNSIYAANEKRRVTIQATLASLSEKISEWKEEAAGLKASADTVVKLNVELDKAEEAYTRASAVLTNKQKLEHSITENRKYLDTKAAKYRAMAKNVPLAKAAQKDVKKAKLVLESALDVFSVAHNKRKTLLEQIKNSVCTECKRPFDEKHLVDAEKKLEKVEVEFQKAKAERDSAKETLSGLEESLDSISKNLPPAGWEEEVESAEGFLAESSSQLEKLNKLKVPDVKEALEEKNRLTFAVRVAEGDNEALSKLLKRINKAIKAKEEEEASLAELPVLDEVDISKLIGRQIKAAELLGLARTDLADCWVEAGAAKAKLDALKLLIKTSEQVANVRLGAEKDAARYGSFARWLKANKAQFLSDIWDGVLALTSEFAAQCTKGYVSQVGRSDSGDFFYLEDGYEAPIQGASGGQKSIIGAGLRLAFASLLPASLGFLVLDEPSADLNDEHAAAMAGALRGSGRQVILVTHRTSEEFSSDSIVVLE